MHSFTHTRRGFTLIELLIVVLIIGILAAVALPQYQKAVLKSRYATLKNLTASIAAAQEIYYLREGTYADDFEKLDLQMPQNTTARPSAHTYVYSWGECSMQNISNTNIQYMVYCENYLAQLGYQQFFKQNDDFAGRRRCIAYTEDADSLQNQLCKAETGANTGSKTGTGTGTYFTWWYQE